MFWYWLVSGLLLILFEFAVPGLVVCFFGVSALIVGALKYFIPELGLAWQLIIFAVGGLLMAVLSRLLIPRGISKRADLDAENIDNDDVSGAVAVCKEEIAPGHPGKVEFRGSFWNAVSDETIAAGENCVIVSRDNLVLKVQR